jgi:hypothetical protein
MAIHKGGKFRVGYWGSQKRLNFLFIFWYSFHIIYAKTHTLAWLQFFFTMLVILSPFIYIISKWVSNSLTNGSVLVDRIMA